MNGTADNLEARALRAFRACCDVEGAAREAALAQACGDDAPLTARVRELLAADAAADAADAAGGPEVMRMRAGAGRRLLLDDVVASMVAGDEEAPPLPESLGPYRVVALLGAGGMGLVYEAEQARPKRRVALKTVHPHLRTDVMLAHFHQEVEVLGGMVHPAIPQVYEAGEEDGIAWLAMELVRGRPLTEHAAGRPLEERLALLVEVIEGVAHAHAAGVAHCDLKPENILVTVEGQPKILDFGLAMRLVARPEERAPRLGVAGTLGYMAPEQRQAEATVDARVDVFALGVVAAEVLAGLPIPKDLALVLGKARHPDPARRHASAEALGDDLTRFLARRPVSARRPSATYRMSLWLARHRGAVRAALTLVGASVLVVLGALGWGAIAAADAEAEARARLLTVERRVSELEALGDLTTADAVFELFTQMHEQVGPLTLHEAWTWRAEREAAAGRLERSTLAWAEAATIAPDEDDQRAALMRLAEAFATAGDWRSLDHVLSRLDAAGADPGATVSLRFATAAYHRELAAAAGVGSAHATAPLVAALAPATRLDPAMDVLDPLRWRGQELVLARDQAARTLRVVDPARGFATVLTRPMPASSAKLPRWVAGSDGWLIELGAGGEASLVSLGEPARAPIPIASPHVAVGWHDARGALQLVIGSAGRERDVRAATLTPGADALVITPAPPAVRAPTSDADELLRADLDRDGTPEIVLALGAWGAYDLRVFHVDDTRRFEPLARRLVGSLGALALIDDGPGAEPLVVASKVDRYPSVSLFGHDAPYGPPAGIYLFAYRQRRLDQVGYVPLPAGLGRVVGIPRIVPGDFDGDGRVDLAVTIERVDDMLTLLLARSGPTTLEPIVMRGITPYVAVQVDDDRAAELVVRVEDVGRRGAWILGAGHDPLPALSRAATPLSPGPTSIDATEVDDEAFLRVWRGARTLSELGLLDRAASNLEAAALVADGDTLEARVLSEAAALRLELGESGRAAVLFERAFARVAPGSLMHTRALAGAGRAWLAALEPQRALERWRELAGSSLAGEDPLARALVAEARATLAWLSPLVEAHAPEVELTWHAPVGPPLEVVAPESLARAPAGGLEVRSFSDQADIARVPLDYRGGRFVLEIALTLSHLEIGAGLRVGLRAEGALRPTLDLLVDGRGGDQSVTRFAVCGGIDDDLPRGIADQRPMGSPPERLRLRLDLWHDAAGVGRASCRVWRDDGVEPVFQAPLIKPLALPPGRYDLTLGGIDNRAWTSSSEARLVLERVHIVGAALAAREPTPLGRAHLDLVNGDFAAALAAYRTLPGAEPFALLAELEVADEATLSARVGSLVGAWRDAEPTLSHALRTRRARLVPLLQRLDPPGFADVFHRVWGVALRYADDPDVRAALLDPALERLSGASPNELLLLTARAATLMRSGDLVRAERTVTRALAALPPDFDAPALVGQASLLAARIAQRQGDLDGARRHLARWRDHQALPDIARERLAADPANAPLVPLL